MGKIYTGGFTSIDGTDYTVTIETENGTGTEDITLSGDPFVTSADNENENIYSPIKCSGATVEFLTPEIKFDIYSASPTGTKVTLKESETDRTVWAGYVTPACYSQPYDELKNYIQLECRDGISALKDVKYIAEEKQIKSFADIIAYCLNKSNCFKYLYISDNVQLSANASDSVIDIFRISESGLFDQKDDVTQPDEDVAWSCYDILSEICQYLGYTLIPSGDIVYIVDYDAIKKNRGTYFRYNIGNTLTGKTQVTLNDRQTIQPDSFADKGNKIDIAEVYNKVTVSDDFNCLNTSGEINGEVNITADSDPYWKETWIENLLGDNWYDTCDTIVEEDDFGNKLNYQIAVHKMHGSIWYYTVVKCYDAPNYKFYRYSKNSPYTPQSRETDGMGYIMNSRGGSYIKYCHIELGDDTEWHASFLYANRNRLSSYPMETRRAEWVRLLNNKLANLNFTDCLLMNNGDYGSRGHIGISNWKNTVEYQSVWNPNGAEPDEIYKRYPCIEYTQSDPAIFGNRNAYVVLKGNVTTHDEYWNPWPMNNGAANDKLKYDKKQKALNGLFIWAKFQWGDMFWTGNKWTTKDSYFKIYWWRGIPDKVGERKKDGKWYQEHYVKRVFDKTLPIIGVDNVTYIVGEEGYYIPAPTEEEGGNLTGDIKLTFYMPRDNWDNHKERCDRYWTGIQCITDFKIEYSINTGGSLGDDSALDSDTVYTNVIENGAINEMEEIKFKICTYDYKNSSYSLVDYLNSAGKSVFVDQTYNKANYSAEGTPMRQEEHMVFKLVTQYEKPRITYNCSVKINSEPMPYTIYNVNDEDQTMKNRDFIIDNIEYDYRLGIAKIKLVEKA